MRTFSITLDDDIVDKLLAVADSLDEMPDDIVADALKLHFDELAGEAPVHFENLGGDGVAHLEAPDLNEAAL